MNCIELVEKSLNDLKQDNPLLVDFFDLLSDYDLIIIGGFIRNSINYEKSRDIDIILNSQDSYALVNVIEKLKLNYTKNRFNGYKLHFTNIDIDIWNIMDHNLYKKGIYKPDFNNLRETTFINYDSLIYDINNKKLDIKYYLECINTNQIDFVGNDDAIKANDSIILSIAKILEINFDSGINISDRVYDYISSFYSLYGSSFIPMLKDEYKKHYDYDMSAELECYILDFLKKEKIKVKK